MAEDVGPGLGDTWSTTRRPDDHPFVGTLSWTGGSAVRDQHSGARFLPGQARRDPDARYLRQRDSRNGLSRLGLGRASFVTFDPSLTYGPHKACRRTKDLRRDAEAFDCQLLANEEK